MDARLSLVLAGLSGGLISASVVMYYNGLFERVWWLAVLGGLGCYIGCNVFYVAYRGVYKWGA